MFWKKLSTVSRRLDTLPVIPSIIPSTILAPICITLAASVAGTPSKVKPIIPTNPVIELNSGLISP